MSSGADGQWQQLLLVAAGTTGARRTSELSGSLALGVSFPSFLGPFPEAWQREGKEAGLDTW